MSQCPTILLEDVGPHQRATVRPPANCKSRVATFPRCHGTPWPQIQLLSVPVFGWFCIAVPCDFQIRNPLSHSLLKLWRWLQLKWQGKSSQELATINGPAFLFLAQPQGETWRSWCFNLNSLRFPFSASPALSAHVRAASGGVQLSPGPKHLWEHICIDHRGIMTDDVHIIHIRRIVYAVYVVFHRFWICMNLQISSMHLHHLHFLHMFAHKAPGTQLQEDESARAAPCPGGCEFTSIFEAFLICFYMPHSLKMNLSKPFRCVFVWWWKYLVQSIEDSSIPCLWLCTTTNGAKARSIYWVCSGQKKIIR